MYLFTGILRLLFTLQLLYSRHRNDESLAILLVLVSALSDFQARLVDIRPLVLRDRGTEIVHSMFTVV